MTFQKGFRNPIGAAFRQSSVDELKSLSISRTSTGTSDFTLAGTPGLRMKLMEVTLVFTGAMRSATADVTMMGCLIQVIETADLQILGAFDMELAAADGSTGHDSYVVPFSRAEDGILLPTGAGFRLQLTLTIFVGSAPQWINVRCFGNIRRRLV